MNLLKRLFKSHPGKNFHPWTYSLVNHYCFKIFVPADVLICYSFHGEAFTSVGCFLQSLFFCVMYYSSTRGHTSPCCAE